MHQQEWGGWVAVGAGEAPLGGGPAASSSGVFRFPGLLVCAGRSSGAQERCADPANGLGAQAVLPLRHPEAAPTAPAKRSGKSTQGASVRPSPRRPGGGGRCWSSAESAQISPVLQALISACVCPALCIYPCAASGRPPRSPCRALPPSRPLCARFWLPTPLPAPGPPPAHRESLLHFRSTAVFSHLFM